VYLQKVHNPTPNARKLFGCNFDEDTLINPGTNDKAGVVIYINQCDESKHEGNVQLFMD